MEKLKRMINNINEGVFITPPSLRYLNWIHNPYQHKVYNSIKFQCCYLHDRPSVSSISCLDLDLSYSPISTGERIDYTSQEPFRPYLRAVQHHYQVSNLDVFWFVHPFVPCRQRWKVFSSPPVPKLMCNRVHLSPTFSWRHIIVDRQTWWQVWRGSPDQEVVWSESL